MMRFAYGAGKYRVEVRLLFCGGDINAAFCGGEAPHIGACALAVPRPSLDKNKRELSASCSVLCVSGHKEDMAAREAALKLAAHFNCVAAVTVGLHIDKARPEDISLLEQNFQACLKTVLQTAVPEKAGREAERNG